MRYTLDTPIADLEFSVRTANVLTNHGCVTLRDAAAKLDTLKSHAKGFGAKGYREVKDVVQYASAAQADLLEDKAYVSYLMEDRLSSITALIHSVENTLMRAALKGHINPDARRQAAFKLRDAAAFLDQLPTLGER